MNNFIFSTIAVVLTVIPMNAADIYVSPSGSDKAAGSEQAPLQTLKKAIESASAGTTIYLREGTYRPSQSEIMRTGAEGVYDCVYNLSKAGKKGSPIVIAGYPGEKAVIDLSDVKPEARIMGFYVKSDYWHLKNFEIIGIQVTQTGHTQSINVGLFGGSNCVIENVSMHDGMGIGVYATRGNNNLVLNCDAYNNYDPVSENGKGGNCDGFGFHLNKTTFTGNVIRGCRAWRNSDDGFDLINNHTAVVIENCWAWENGYDANKVSRGDGTGFKSGGFGMGTVKAGTVAPRNVVRNCIAWSNKQQGFYANHDLGGLDFLNNSAFRNKRNFNMVNRKSIEEAVDVDGYDHVLKNNLAYKSTLSGADCVNIDTALCTVENNTFLPEMKLSDSDFESLDASQLLRPRKEDGSLPDITFLRLKESSKAYDLKIGYQFPYGDESDVDMTIAGEPGDDADATYYNLQGVAVKNPSGGIYIRKGKKILIP